jgi:ribose transport system substrate-binding protein
MSARPERSRVKGAALLAFVALLSALALSACGGGSSSSSSADSSEGGGASESESKSASSESSAAEGEAGATETAAAGSDAWCGPEGITLGIQDGGGLNTWSKESLKEVQIASKSCPAVEKEIVVDADFEPQKAITGMQSMISQGANAIVVIPDSGNCVEAAGMRQAVQHDIVVVPWGADPCGTEGADFTKLLNGDNTAFGREGAEFVIEQMGGKGKLLFEGGPAGNSATTEVATGVVEAVEKNPGVELVEPVSSEEWPVTNWDPAETKKVTSALLAKYPEIDGLVNDYGASGVAEIKAFQDAGRKVPPISTLDSNQLGCAWQEAKEKGEEFPLMTVSTHNWLGSYAAQYAIAEASGGTAPTLKNNGLIPLGQYENSVSGREPACEESVGPEASLSNEMSEAEKDKIALEQ